MGRGKGIKPAKIHIGVRLEPITENKIISLSKVLNLSKSGVIQKALDIGVETIIRGMKA